MPQTDYDQVIAVFKYKGCILNSARSLYECACTNQSDPSYPTFTMKMSSGKSSVTIQVDPRYYFSYDTTVKKCTLLLQSSTMLGSYTVLGDPIVRAFSMAHDIEN